MTVIFQSFIVLGESATGLWEVFSTRFAFAAAALRGAVELGSLPGGSSLPGGAVAGLATGLCTLQNQIGCTAARCK